MRSIHEEVTSNNAFVSCDALTLTTGPHAAVPPCLWKWPKALLFMQNADGTAPFVSRQHMLSTPLKMTSHHLTKYNLKAIAAEDRQAVIIVIQSWRQLQCSGAFAITPLVSCHLPQVAPMFAQTFPHASLALQDVSEHAGR